MPLILRTRGVTEAVANFHILWKRNPGNTNAVQVMQSTGVEIGD